jgi:rhodanese-related sulfurtransferase
MFFKRSGKNDIEVSDAYNLIIENESNQAFIILDVRSPGEYSREHIENAMNIDYNSNNFKSEVDKLDKNKKYLVYCHSGQRSSNAVKVMEQLGFSDLTNLSGGIMKWNRNKLPVI